MSPNLEGYDWIVINSSAGKDSQAMLDYLVELAKAARDPAATLARMVVVHADMGRVEWSGTKELAERQARHYGIRFEVERRPQGDLLDHVRRRGMWMSSKQRYCTSDHKRGQVGRLFTRLSRETRRGRVARVSILNCMGMRADESPVRAKLATFGVNQRYTNGLTVVCNWLPIHDKPASWVWKRIKASGVPYHPAYDKGMPRLSCCFCIFAPRSALLLAGHQNPELLDEYVRVEAEIGHSFKKGFRIAEIKAAIQAGEQPVVVSDWRM